MDPISLCSKHRDVSSDLNKSQELLVVKLQELDKIFSTSHKESGSATENQNILARRNSFSPRLLNKGSALENEIVAKRNKRITNTISHSFSEKSRNSSVFSPPFFSDERILEKKENQNNVFVRSIFYIEDVRAEKRFQNCKDETITSILHNENKVSMREAVLGYGFLMTTPQFIQALYERFVENEVKTKRECLLIFMDWFKFHKFYCPDTEEQEQIKPIKLFIEAAEKEFGKQFFCHVRKELYSKKNKNVQPLADSLEFDFKKFADGFKGNAEQMAKECLASTIELQKRIDAGVFDSKKRKIMNDRIAKANNNLKDCIINDMLESKEKKDRIKKYIFYISLGKHSLKIGDLFTCMAIFGAFQSTEIEKKDFGKEPKKHTSFINELIEIAATSQGVARRNTLLLNKNVPIYLPHFFNECEGIKEKIEPFIKNKKNEKEINAHFIAAVALFIGDLVERQAKTENIKSQMHIFEALI